MVWRSVHFHVKVVQTVYPIFLRHPVNFNRKGSRSNQWCRKSIFIIETQILNVANSSCSNCCEKVPTFKCINISTLLQRAFSSKNNKSSQLNSQVSKGKRQWHRVEIGEDLRSNQRSDVWWETFVSDGDVDRRYIARLALQDEALKNEVARISTRNFRVELEFSSVLGLDRNVPGFNCSFYSLCLVLIKPSQHRTARKSESVCVQLIFKIRWRPWCSSR